MIYCGYICDIGWIRCLDRGLYLVYRVIYVVYIVIDLYIDGDVILDT